MVFHRRHYSINVSCLCRCVSSHPSEGCPQGDVEIIPVLLFLSAHDYEVEMDGVMSAHDYEDYMIDKILIDTVDAALLLRK